MPGHFCLSEQIGKIVLNAFQQGVLLRAGNQDAVHTGVLEGLKHSCGARHYRRLAQFVEVACLHAVECARLVVGDVFTDTGLEFHLDDFGSGHTLHLVEFIARALDAVFLHEFHPCLGVILHRIIEHAVAVDECGADV